MLGTGTGNSFKGSNAMFKCKFGVITTFAAKL